MTFSTDKLPALGQRIIIGDIKDDKAKLCIGIVFGILKRYKLDPLIFVDVETKNADTMDHASGCNLERVSPYFCHTQL